MAYRHGVYIQELPTALIPMRTLYARMPVVVGTAPVHILEGGADLPVNKPVLCFSKDEFVAAFKDSTDLASFTLCEAAEVLLTLYRVAPVVFINVLDPAKHKAAVAEADYTFAAGVITLAHTYPLNLVVKSADGATTYTAGVDYTVNRIGGVVTRLADGAIAAEATVKVSYDRIDPGAVTVDDIIGGVDPETGAKTGLELVDSIFPRFRLIPGQLLCPGWSIHPEVAIYLAAKSVNINGFFRAAALVDVPPDGEGAPAGYTGVPAWKNDYNYTDEDLIVCWPKVKVGEKTHWLSTHLAGLCLDIDEANEDIPFVSPSNKRLNITGADHAGQELWLGPEQANYLNSEGIVTVLNFDGGWKAWGNRTGVYPSNTDPKDSFIPVRAMFNWLHNTLTLSFWNRVDYPLRRRHVHTIVDSANIWLNGLAAREVILGGRCAFLEVENPLTDLMDGIARFHVWFTPPSPNRVIEFITEYDPNYQSVLFT
ncbi:MAG: phage tail sheath family protein [Deltaproteobacteria bacterium]|nr:phage tail sheath family protein [Deltaproteobacteria bacterium]